MPLYKAFITLLPFHFAKLYIIIKKDKKTFCLLIFFY